MGAAEVAVSLPEEFYLLTFRLNSQLGEAEFEAFGEQFEKFIAERNAENSQDSRDWRGRVRSAVNEKKGVLQLSCLEERPLVRVREKLKQTYGDKLSLVFNTKCEQFAVNYYRLSYDPGDPNRYFDLAVAASYDEFQSEVNRVGWYIFWRSLGLIVGAAVLASLFSRMVTQPLRQMTAALDGFDENSTEIKLPVYAHDEIGVLANAFRTMFRQVRKRTADLRQLNDELDQRVRLRTAQLEEKTAELQRSTAQLQEANGYKTDGLRGIAHELRAPLTGVDAAVKYLESGMGGTLSEENLKRVKRIDRDCQHITTIVKHLDQIARCENHRLELDKTEFAINDFVENAVGMLEESFRKKRLQVRVRVNTALSSISADEGRTRQVLINLLSNAEKYTPAGGSVDVIAEQVEVTFNESPPGQDLKISVRDTGVGISDEDLPKVFNDFHRAENAKLNARGLGLGLALARRLVELHWGTVGIESKLGEGTTAWFTLPLDGREHECTQLDGRHAKQARV